jgi:hypothetical protein
MEEGAATTRTYPGDDLDTAGEGADLEDGKRQGTAVPRCGPVQPHGGWEGYAD